MPSRDIALCVPKLQNAWALGSAGFAKLYPGLPQPFLTCTHRSVAEQNALYAQGRTTPGTIVTKAKGGRSKHNSNPSRAFDIAFKRADGTLDWSVGLFAKFAALIKPEGIAWGGDWKFKNAPHYEV